MLKRVFALLLAVVMCLSVFSACTTTKKKTNTSNAQAEIELGGNWDKPLFDEEVSFQIYMPVNDNYTLEGSYLDQLLKMRENLDVEWVGLNSFAEQFLLRAVENDIPEITWTNSSLQRDMYGPVGGLLNINDYLDKMPNLKAVLEKYPNAIEAYTDRKTGGMYAVPCIQEANTTAYAYIYRQDVFQKLNMEWPTTQDGFYNALKTIKQAYPKSYPFVLRQMTNLMQGLIYWLPTWGTSRVSTGNYNLFKQNADGTLEYQPLNQGMKECLAFLNKLYDEGLLHPNLLSLSANEWTIAFASETSFVGWDKMDRIPIQLQPAGEGAGIDGFKLVAGAPIAMGSKGVAATFVNEEFSTYCFVLSSKLAAKGNEIRLNQVLAFIDWLYSEEGIVTTNWGGEGTTWEKDADGNYKFLDSLLATTDPQYTRGMGVPGTYGVKTWDAYKNWQTEDQLESLELANKYATLPNPPSLTGLYTKEEENIWDTYSTSLWSNTGNGIQSFIIGAGGYDIEKDWDNWVAKMTGPAYKYAQLKEIHENAYARLGK